MTQSTQTRRSTSRKTWAAWLGLSTVLLLSLPSIISASPALVDLSPPLSAGSPHLLKRAAKYLEDSEADIELTFEANDSYYLEKLELGACVSKLSLPVTPSTGARAYNAITAPDASMIINFYTDEECKEYEFSVSSEIHQYSGAFASVRYLGQFSGVKPGVFDKEELSKTVLPEGDPINMPIATGASSSFTNDGINSIPAPENILKTLSPYNPLIAGAMGAAGMLATVGLISMVIILHRKRQEKKRNAFMAVSSGREEYEDEADKNGPHSSALMRSRAGASFDGEPYADGRYHDEA